MVTISPNSQSYGTFGAFKPPIRQKKSFWPYLIVILLIILLAASYYIFIYLGIGFSLTTKAITAAAPLTSNEMKIIQLPRFQFDIFDSPFYKSLKSYGALPVIADSLGRINPFVPY